MKKMHNKLPAKLSAGFTLVELLIVIALITILSVGVLATINPVEQRNKATDANTSNDAGEVLNAYERYYTNANEYPWMTIDKVTYASPDEEYVGLSNQVGSGLCSGDVEATIEDPDNPGQQITNPDAAHTACTNYNTPGVLITGDELKTSFLQKGYGAVPADTSYYNVMNLLYIVKTGTSNGNSIYVCYIPKANSNRLSTSKLVDLNITDGLPSQKIDAIGDIADGTGADRNFAENAKYFDSGTRNAFFTFLTPETSLFKCVP